MAILPKDEFQNLVSMNPDEYRETLRNKKGWNESSANQFEQLTRAKSPIELANEIEKTTFDENKYNEMIDFIANQRANNISLPDVKEMMDKKYGSNYKDMIEYAFSKWAE